MLRAVARRLWAVLTVPRAAVVVVEYELLPWFLAVLERWLAWRGCRMVVRGAAGGGDYLEARLYR